MRGANNQFLIRMGISPETETKIRELKVYAGQQYVLVYDKNNCVGVVFEHYEKRGSPANGQAEICFFDRYLNEYGKWHRIFIYGERLKYEKLEAILGKQHELIYWGAIKA